MIDSEIKWLGLVIRSESDQPHEWWAIGWSVRNRVLSDRYPDLYESVILSKKQFSYFNQFAHLPSRELIYQSALRGYAGDSSGWNENDLTDAEECANEIILSPRYKAPFGIDVMHYYSPVSMKPRGAKPAWLPSAKRLLTPSGIDPQRFVFAAGVP